MANYNKKISNTGCRIGEARFSYCHVFSKGTKPDGSEGSYSVSILIPKSDTQAVQMLQECIRAAQEEGKGKWGGKVPANCKIPLRDGDAEREEDENYKGCYFINAKSNKKPGVKILKDGEMCDALDEEDFYSGCYGAVTLNFFAYNSNGNKGIGAGLNHLIKTKDGDKFSGGTSAESDFGDMTFL